MKKIVKSSLFVLAAVAVSVACSKEMSPVIPGNQVTITAYIPDELTKVSFTPDANLDGPVKIAWEDLDKIRVIDHNDVADNSQFEIQPGFTDHQASFSGTAVEATSYDILYPGTMESVAEAEAVQFGIQTQTNNANTAQLAYMALLSNVNTYENVEFSEAWATAHGGSFKQTGILRLRIQLPDGFKGDVASVTVNAPSALFYKSNALISKEKVSSLKLNFTGAGATPDAGVITGYVMLPWENVTIAANTTLSVIVETAEHKFYTKLFTPSTSGDVTLTMGRVNAIKINKSEFGAASTTFAGGSGTADDPWLIATPAHMLNISGNLEAGKTKYFKMIDDVDMTGKGWNMLNGSSPYDKLVFLDGNYKTISHLGGTMFSVFKGTVQNLALDGSEVSTGARKGVFAQYIQGTDNYLTNVDICNVSTFEASSNECGGMVGRINGGTAGYTTATFEDCDVIDVNVNSSAYAGGLIGGVEAKVILINCTRTGGAVSNTGTAATASSGGLIGRSTAEADVSITNCSVSKSGSDGSVSGLSNVGGLIGNMVYGSISRCHADVTVTGTGYYVGGLIGDLNTTVSDVEVSECYYKAGTISAARFSGGLIGQKEGESYGITISNCYVRGTVTATARNAGGLLGAFTQGKSATISNCFVSGPVSASSFTAGGLIGRVDVEGLTMTKCLAWNSSVSASADDVGVHYSSGAVIGYAANVKVTLSANYRKKGFSFSDCAGNSENVLTFNSGDKSNEKLDVKSSYIRPYHGKKETSETTVSGFAKNSGIQWSSSIWDTSTDIPTLKNNPE